MAPGRLATGNMKAKDADIVTGNIRWIGWIDKPLA